MEERARCKKNRKGGGGWTHVTGLENGCDVGENGQGGWGAKKKVLGEVD